MTADQLLEMVRVALSKGWDEEGAKTLFSNYIYKVFNIIDVTKNKSIGKYEFTKGIQSITKLSERECLTVFSKFDINKTGTIDFSEFMSKMLYVMNNTRYDGVKAVFKKVDINNSGVIALDDFVKTNNTIYRGEYFMEHVMGEYNTDNRITYDEFITYYNDLSLIYETDKEFIDHVNNSWIIPTPSPNTPTPSSDAPTPSHDCSSTPVKSLLEQVKVAFNKQWVKDGPDVCYTDSVHKTFDKLDSGNFGFILKADFIKGVQSITKLSEEECLSIFKLFDTNNSQSLDFAEFIKTISIQMNKMRYNAVKGLFDKIDVDKSGTITVADFMKTNKIEPRGAYFMSRIIGKYNTDNVITYKEFINYYSDLSLVITNDSVFIEYINSKWIV